MKLLLDQNISRKLVAAFNDNFPGTTHVALTLEEKTSDVEIWNFARDSGYTIVTKDDDFEQRSILFGHPPKIIRVRLGNCKSADIERLFSESRETIRAFIADDKASFLPIP